MNIIINDKIIKENNIKNPPTKKVFKRSLNDVPKRTLLEEIGNSITHGIGALCAILMFILMLLNSNTSVQMMSSMVYGITNFF